MMRMKTKTKSLSPLNSGSGGGGRDGEWEMRPGGMLVQKRNPDTDQNRAPTPTIRVRVKYGSAYHEINISSQSTFGELKKMLSGPTGLHHQDQKLLFKDKERDSKAFLDIVGVKDKSKLVLVEDAISQEKRLLEMRRNAKMEKTSKLICEISLEIDRLSGQVSELESVISRGGKVAAKEIMNLIDQLMNQLLKLDGIIITDGDVKLHRKMQVTRVQKCVETLDMLKTKNSMPSSNGSHIPIQQPSPIIQQHQQQNYSNGQILSPNQQQKISPPIQQQIGRCSLGYSAIETQQQHQQRHSQPHSTLGAVVITTQWETFDFMPTPLPAEAPPSTATIASDTTNAIHPKFNWDLL